MVHTEHGWRCSQETAGEREIAFAKFAWPLGFNSYWQVTSFLNNFPFKNIQQKPGKRFATLKSSFQTESNICYIVGSCLNLDFTALGYYVRYMLMGLNAMIMMQQNWIFIQRPGTQSNLKFSNYRRNPVQDAESQCKIKK